MNELDSETSTDLVKITVLIRDKLGIISYIFVVVVIVVAEVLLSLPHSNLYFSTIPRLAFGSVQLETKPFISQ